MTRNNIAVYIIALAIVLIINFPKNSVSVEPCNENLPEIFFQFLAGNLPVRNLGDEQYVYNLLNFNGLRTKPENDYRAAYALLDVNSDGQAELLLGEVSSKYIIAEFSGELRVVGSFGTWGTFLNDGMVLHHRPGAAWLHHDYFLEVYSNELQKYIRTLDFSIYDTDGDNLIDSYTIDGEEVSEEVWHKVADPILAVGNDKIEWFWFDSSTGKSTAQ